MGKHIADAVGWVVLGLVILGVVFGVVKLVDNVQDNDRLKKHDHYEACQDIRNEAIRTLCVNGR